MPKPRTKRTDINTLKDIARRVALNGGTVLEQDPEFQSVQEMALIYEKALSDFKRNPTLKYLKGLVKRGTREYGIWLRCVENANNLGVGFDTYIKAQFYYFNEWGQRSPRPQECCSRQSKKNSMERVKQYLQDNIKESAVSGPTKQYFVPDRVKASDAARQMQAMMQNFKTDEKGVFLHFGKQSVLYFDRDWLKNNNIYNSLVERGEI